MCYLLIKSFFCRFSDIKRLPGKTQLFYLSISEQHKIHNEEEKWDLYKKMQYLPQLFWQILL